jgi:catechol 2,3-dioxygenase-like lactoylglutathione lyase family enzyme
MLRNDHTAFQVRDLDQAIDFYTEKLGLKLLFRETDEAHGEAFAFLELEGGNLELLQSLDTEMPPAPDPEPPYTPHLAIATDDLESFAQSLGDKGVPILKGPMTIPGKVTWLYIADPDNNVVEFVQWLDGSC